MRYIKLYEAFIAPEDKNTESDYTEIASVIVEGLKEYKVDFKEKIYYDNNKNLIMDLVFNDIKDEEEKRKICNRVRLSMAAFEYNEDYKCVFVKDDEKFILRIKER